MSGTRLAKTTTFQFLMVRLKARGERACRNPDHGFQFLMVRLKATAVTLEYSLDGFQFLMVRLKVFGTKDGETLDQISIPYGSIKRPLRPQARKDRNHFNSLWFD